MSWGTKGASVQQKPASAGRKREKMFSSKTRKNQEIHLDDDGTSTNIVYGDITNISRQTGTFHVENWGGLGPIDMPKNNLVGEYQGKKYFHVGRDAWYPWQEVESKAYWPLPHR